jgi:zinc D-Ala-D-Ala carboxypeptidase
MSNNLTDNLSPHFQLGEFLHNGSFEDVTPEIMANLGRIAYALEHVRIICGNRPIHINSGFRTPQHNKEVCGAPDSQHLYGKAADIVVQGIGPRVVQELLKDWPGGLGSYSAWTHCDIGPKRRWNGP